MLKSLNSLDSCAENFLLIQISSILSVIFTRLWLKCQRVFWWASCTSARHAGSFNCLMTSLILITMDNGRGHCAYWQSCKVPNQTHRGMKKIRKMYAIKQIKICAEYRDMLPRPRLDLSGTPGLRPIGLSPGSWQTSLGLGSMSRYSALILICITQQYVCFIAFPATQHLHPSFNKINMLYNHQMVVKTYELIYIVQAAHRKGKIIVKWDYCDINVSDGIKPLPESMLTSHQ